MLIQKPRAKLGTSGVTLTDDLLGPLSLSPNGVCWLAIETGLSGVAAPLHQTNPSSADLIVTSVPREYWPDLWRLEAETHDEAGIIALVTEILGEKGMMILNAEGAANGIDSSTHMQFTFSAARYRHAVDRNSDNRRADPDAQLRALEFELTLNLLDASLLAMKSRPRVKVRRMGAFHRLDRQVSANKYTLISPDGMTLNRRKIAISQRIRSALKRRFEGDIYYSLSADTTERIIRGYFFGERNAIGHIQVEIPIGNSARAFSHISEHILKNGGNVVRYRAQNRFDKRDAAASADTLVFDISFVSIRSGQSNDDLTARLFAKFAKDTGMQEMGVRGLTSHAPALADMVGN